MHSSLAFNQTKNAILKVDIRDSKGNIDKIMNILRSAGIKAVATPDNPTHFLIDKSSLTKAKDIMKKSNIDIKEEACQNTIDKIILECNKEKSKMKSFKEYVGENKNHSKRLLKKFNKQLETILGKFNIDNRHIEIEEQGVNLKPFGVKDYSNGEVEVTLSGVTKEDIQKITKLIAQIENKLSVLLVKSQSGFHNGKNEMGYYSMRFDKLNTQDILD